LEQFVDRDFGDIIALCDKAFEVCPVFPGDPERIHWSFSDPAAAEGTPEEQVRILERIAGTLRPDCASGLPCERFKSDSLAAHRRIHARSTTL
jgi:hypothetical protein